MLKLLVVEDHALVREGLVGLLSQVEDGVHVFESADFESALSVLDSEGDFDLVLLDLALPGIDGFAGLHPAPSLSGDAGGGGFGFRRPADGDPGDEPRRFRLHSQGAQR